LRDHVVPPEPHVPRLRKYAVNELGVRKPVRSTEQAKKVEEELVLMNVQLRRMHTGVPGSTRTAYEVIGKTGPTDGRENLRLEDLAEVLRGLSDEPGRSEKAVEQVRSRTGRGTDEQRRTHAGGLERQPHVANALASDDPEANGQPKERFALSRGRCGDHTFIGAGVSSAAPSGRG